MPYYKITTKYDGKVLAIECINDFDLSSKLKFIPVSSIPSKKGTYEGMYMYKGFIIEDLELFSQTAQILNSG